MRLATDSERRVLLLQRAAVAIWGAERSVAFLHTYTPDLGTTPAAAAWIGGDLGRRAVLLLYRVAVHEVR
jgi:hypothetical protein